MKTKKETRIYPIMAKIEGNYMMLGANPSMNDFPADYIWVVEWVEAESPSQAILKVCDFISKSYTRAHAKEEQKQLTKRKKEELEWQRYLHSDNHANYRM